MAGTPARTHDEGERADSDERTTATGHDGDAMT
jgi:hypothetical protein